MNATGRLHLFLGILAIVCLAIATPAPPLLAAPSGKPPAEPPEHPFLYLDLDGDGRADDLRVGAALRPAAAKADTIQLYGGPGRLEGKFQTAAGDPDRQGWTGLDLTATGNHFQVSTYAAANLDPATSGNRAWYVGDETLPSCEPGDPVGGYGNDWYDRLVWSAPVTEPASAVTVRLTARLNHDVEPDYDNLYLQVLTAAGWVDLAVWTGTAAGVDVDVLAALAPGDLQGVGADEVHLRWLFASDPGWSDADCLYTGSGAAQIDLIAVTFDQGGGEQLVGHVETCEDGAPLQWTELASSGVGDFSQLWPELEDLDFCNDNDSPQFAFIDDGLVVPGTGGTACISWCYGPAGWIVNTTGGLMRPDHHLANFVVSPPMALPAGPRHELELAFDVYRHEQLWADSPGMFYNFEVSTTADPTGETGWSEWRHWIWPGYYGGPGYVRHSERITQYLEPGAAWLQVRLGVLEAGHYWGWEGNNGTPAPYFDNVTVRAWEPDGPDLRALARELAQDAFPEAGVIDPLNWGAASVRFDMAKNVAPAGAPVVLGDSVVVSLAPGREGAWLELPRMHYRLFPNPHTGVFDAHRTSGLPLAGSVEGDTCYSSSGYPVQDRYCFDLPDSGFLFPGDVLHYYFTATEWVAAQPFTTMLPADTTGFSRPDLWHVYPEEFAMRALPALDTADPSGHAGILVWLDDEGGSRDRWFRALAGAGFDLDRYDVFVTTGAASRAGNGLGSAATPALLDGYDTIVYAGGRLETPLSTGLYDASLDVQLLSGWLDTGDRHLLVTGDNVVSGLVDIAGTTFRDAWLGVNSGPSDVRPYVGGQTSPGLLFEPLNTIVPADVVAMTADGGCPLLRTIDAITPGPAAQVVARFADQGGLPAGDPYVAGVAHRVASPPAVTVTFPFDITALETGGELPEPFWPYTPPPSAAAVVLHHVLRSFGETPSLEPPSPAPTPLAFRVGAHPNPFNPRVTVAYALPQAAHLAVELFDVRGRKVATLHDGPAQAGPGRIVWDGRDRTGREVAGGVYFCEVRTPEHRKVVKLTLVR
ncbi:MAG: hypothetical protein R6X25_15880 [Candidatus Krumholzibacteriia bacterium]